MKWVSVKDHLPGDPLSTAYEYDWVLVGCEKEGVLLWCIGRYIPGDGWDLWLDKDKHIDPGITCVRCGDAYDIMTPDMITHWFDVPNFVYPEFDDIPIGERETTMVPHRVSEGKDEPIWSKSGDKEV